jgi:hypothetical protein
MEITGACFHAGEKYCIKQIAFNNLPRRDRILGRIFHFGLFLSTFSVIPSAFAYGLTPLPPLGDRSALFAALKPSACVRQSSTWL